MVGFVHSKHGVIGCGEVGSALSQLYRDAGLHVGRHDPEKGLQDSPEDWRVVHVCVPARALPRVIVAADPDALVIVHSTVEVGTCRKYADMGWRVVHAPVRGVHPDLASGLRAFTMPVGCHPDRIDGSEAVKVLEAIGITAEVWEGWEHTELSKLFSTTEYGLHVLWMRHMADVCDRFGLSFDLVYREWRTQYNEGYFALGKAQFMRPMLSPMPGPIGGHCVLPNAELLAGDSHMARMVAKEGQEDWSAPAALAERG